MKQVELFPGNFFPKCSIVLDHAIQDIIKIALKGDKLKDKEQEIHLHQVGSYSSFLNFILNFDKSLINLFITRKAIISPGDLDIRCLDVYTYLLH